MARQANSSPTIRQGDRKLVISLATGSGAPMRNTGFIYASIIGRFFAPPMPGGGHFDAAFGFSSRPTRFISCASASREHGWPRSPASPESALLWSRSLMQGHAAQLSPLRHLSVGGPASLPASAAGLLVVRPGARRSHHLAPSTPLLAAVKYDSAADLMISRASAPGHMSTMSPAAALIRQFSVAAFP